MQSLFLIGLRKNRGLWVKKNFFKNLFSFSVHRCHSLLAHRYANKPTWDSEFVNYENGDFVSSVWPFVKKEEEQINKWTHHEQKSNIDVNQTSAAT